MKKIFRLFLLGMFVLLASCAKPPMVTPPPTVRPAMTWAQHQEQLNAVQNWDLSGAVGIRQPGQINFVNLRWIQQGQSYYQQLSGSFGLGAIEIRGRPGKITLTKGGTTTATAFTPEQLVWQTFGWQLPISSLYYWVRGLPVPNVPATARFDQANRLAHLKQQGWNVTYVEYAAHQGIDLPKKIVLTNSQFEVTLVIKQWNLVSEQIPQ